MNANAVETGLKLERYLHWKADKKVSHFLFSIKRISLVKSRFSSGEPWRIRNIYLRVGSKINWHSVCKMSSLYGTFADRLCQVIFVRSLRVGSKINWHSVCKMSSVLGGFCK